jgi:hypothetical protein
VSPTCCGNRHRSKGRAPVAFSGEDRRISCDASAHRAGKGVLHTWGTYSTFLSLYNNTPQFTNKTERGVHVCSCSVQTYSVHTYSVRTYRLVTSVGKTKLWLSGGGGPSADLVRSDDAPKKGPKRSRKCVMTRPNVIVEVVGGSDHQVTSVDKT